MRLGLYHSCPIVTICYIWYRHFVCDGSTTFSVNGFYTKFCDIDCDIDCDIVMSAARVGRHTADFCHRGEWKAGLSTHGSVLLVVSVQPRNGSHVNAYQWMTVVYRNASISSHVKIIQIGRAHVWTPVTSAHLVCRLLLEKKKKKRNTTTTFKTLLIIITSQVRGQ